MRSANIDSAARVYRSVNAGRAVPGDDGRVTCPEQTFGRGREAGANRFFFFGISRATDRNGSRRVQRRALSRDATSPQAERAHRHGDSRPGGDRAKERVMRRYGRRRQLETAKTRRTSAGRTRASARAREKKDKSTRSPASAHTKDDGKEDRSARRNGAVRTRRGASTQRRTARQRDGYLSAWPGVVKSACLHRAVVNKPSDVYARPFASSSAGTGSL